MNRWMLNLAMKTVLIALLSIASQAFVQAQTDADWLQARSLRSSIKPPIIEKRTPLKQKQAVEEASKQQEEHNQALLNSKADSAVFPTAQNNAVFAKSDSIAFYNKRFKNSKGYRILVYNGSNRAEADAAKEKIYRHFPNVEVYYQYTQPVFKVKAGDFVHRMRVVSVAEEMKKVFPNLIIVPETVNLKP